MVDVVTSILAGGAGSRLFPLTEKRSKPAVPIAGRFRLIDIPISNCIHSGLRKIFILTQYSTESLHRHIFTTYRFDGFTKDFITILSAQQTPESRDWYQGTADAVRQNLRFLKGRGDLVLVLSGDHLYRMDYQKFIDFHLKKKADLSISVYPVIRNKASDLGLMKVNDTGRIEEFREKPKKPEELVAMEVTEDIFRKFHMNPSGRTHLASMGIYLFQWDVLFDLLNNTAFEDFGREVIPNAIERKKVFAYFFDGYWEDIGTIRSFFDVHIELTQPLPKFNFYDENKPIFTHARFLPGSKILSSEVYHSILCEGSIINKSKIMHSIIGIRSRIGENCFLERTIVMGADYFESDAEISANTKQGVPKMGIGHDCEIRSAIIDKNARIGSGVKLVNAFNIKEKTETNYVIRDGIVVIPKNSVIPDGTVI